MSDQDVTDCYDSSYTGDCSRKGGVLQDLTDRYSVRATCVHACIVFGCLQFPRKPRRRRLAPLALRDVLARGGGG